MRIFVATLWFIACAAFTSAMAQSAPPAWQEYRSATGGFRVEMPGKPIEGAGGRNVFVLRGKGTFVVSYSDITGQYLNAPVDQNLDRVRDVAADGTRAKLLGEKRETLDGVPTRRLTIDTLQGMVMTERLVIDKNHLFQIGVTGPPGYSDSAEAQRFLNSFALVH